MSQTGIKSETFLHEVTKNTEKAMIVMQPQLSPDLKEKPFQNFNSNEATQKKLYVNSIRIATTLAAAINNKNSSYINKNWPSGESRNPEELNCDNDEFNEDIDIDGYETHQSDDEIDTRQVKDIQQSTGPANLGPNNSDSSPSCKDLSLIHI